MNSLLLLRILPNDSDDTKFSFQENNFQPRGQQTFIEMEFPVNYVSRCLRTVPYTHEDNSKYASFYNWKF